MNELKRILLVEDSPNDAELTLEALSEINLANEIEWFNDGEQVLDYLNCRGAYTGRLPVNPILILLDLKLPKMDGRQVLQEIRKTPRLCTIPVVVMTSSREESDLVNCYANGVNAYVVKPVNFADFMESVKALGVFWAAVNEPPPFSKDAIQRGHAAGEILTNRL
jgi:CheY-like chemotaxis protein